MKTIYGFMALAAIAALSVSCDKEQTAGDGQPSKVEMTFTSRAAGQSQVASGTKTALQSGEKVVWTAGDAIGIFGNSGKAEQFALESIDESDASVATFKGSALPADTYYAVYPYDADAELSGDAISAELPAVQTAAGDGTFAAGVNLSAAVAENGNLQFENLCGLVTLTLSSVPEGYSLESVTLEGRNGEKISGEVSVSVPDLKAVAGENAGTSVTLAAAEGSYLSAEAYVFTVIPATFSNGIRVTFDYGEKGKAEIVTDQALTVNAGENHVLPALEAKIQTLVPLDGIKHWPNDDNTGALPNEMTNYNTSFPYAMLFDDIIDNNVNMWHTTSAGIANNSLTEDHPIIVTFDLGAEYNLSSYKVWGRYGGTVDNPMGDIYEGKIINYFAFGSYNPRAFKLYGSAEEPKNTTDEAYWAVDGGWLNDWTLLADNRIVRPSQDVPTVQVSGQSGDYWIPTEEDYKAAADGFEFAIDRSLSPVRYVRMVITETWDLQERYRISFGELHFYSYTPDGNEE